MGHSQIDKSPFCDEIVAMLKDKGQSNEPTYKELSESIEERYNEDITPTQLQTYMSKHVLPEEKMPTKEVQKELDKKRDTIDIASKRADLVEIQQNRREKAQNMEEDLGGMLTDQMNEQLKLEDHLLNSLSEDYEKLGHLDSVSGVDIKIEQNQANESPMAQMIRDSLEDTITVSKSGDESDDGGEEVFTYGDPGENTPEQDEEEENVVLEGDPEEISYEDIEREAEDE